MKIAGRGDPLLITVSHAFLEQLVPVLVRGGNYEILFCFDLSPDRTEDVIRQEIARNACILIGVLGECSGREYALRFFIGLPIPFTNYLCNCFSVFMPERRDWRSPLYPTAPPQNVGRT